MKLLQRRSRGFIIAALFAFAANEAVPANDTTADPSQAFTAQRVTVRSTETRDFDWAKLQARASVAYVSSGFKASADKMIDNDLQTSFAFSRSDETPMAIVALAQSARLHRVTAVFKAEDSRVEILLLNELPKDAADLRSAAADASIVARPDERGVMVVDFSVSSARYVALRWKGTKSQEPLTVAEIGAFSNDPVEPGFDQDVRLATNDTQPPLVPLLSP